MELGINQKRTARSTRKKPPTIKKEVAVYENTVKFAPIFNGKLVSNNVTNRRKDSKMFHQPKRSFQGHQHQTSEIEDEESMGDDEILEILCHDHDNYKEKNKQKLLLNTEDCTKTLNIYKPFVKLSIIKSRKAVINNEEINNHESMLNLAGKTTDSGAVFNQDLNKVSIDKKYTTCIPIRKVDSRLSSKDDKEKLR